MGSGWRAFAYGLAGALWLVVSLLADESLGVRVGRVAVGLLFLVIGGWRWRTLDRGE